MASFQLRFGRSYDEEEDDSEDEEEEFEYEEMLSDGTASPPPLMMVTTTTTTQAAEKGGGGGGLVGAVVGALRRSLVMCSAGKVGEEDEEDSEDEEEEEGIQIGRPTDVRHVSHVTFDRFGGFLGLPADLEPDVPRRTPSASVNVFGVSPTSLQCSFDHRGNSVPTILLMMQRKLYEREGLKIEGIFRINAENSQEIYVREQLNSGMVPDEVDLHCLAGLIKAWFRELPTGVLDSLSPEQVMHCNTEEDCALLAALLPPVEAALLDWAINLMADVVEHENHNKMNARNIAMVFAPNMTQMADPLTALIHAVQVMNFLKTLILKTLKEREATGTPKTSEPCSGSPNGQDKPPTPENLEKPIICSNQKGRDQPIFDMATCDQLLFGPVQLLDYRENSKFKGPEKHDIDGQDKPPTPENLEKPIICSNQKGRDQPIFDMATCDQLLFGPEQLLDYRENSKFKGPEKHDIDRPKRHAEFSHFENDLNNKVSSPGKGFGNRNEEGMFDKFSFRKGVERLCRHPVFQLSRSMKKSTDVVVFDAPGEPRQAWGLI